MYILSYNAIICLHLAIQIRGTLSSRDIEAVVQRCSVKKVFLEISQNSQENTCARSSFLIKLQASTLLKKRLWHRCFPVNFAVFLRPFIIEHVWWLLLKLKNCMMIVSFLENFQHLLCAKKGKSL